MKTKLTAFLTGALALILIAALSMSALASDGWTIRVSPINILVNGEVFQPKDSKGNNVQCFVVDGCTYAPVRALAEAYGLEVGYDAATNTATVNSPSAQTETVAPAARADDFAAQWEVAEKPVTRNGDERIFTARYAGSLGMEDFKQWWKSYDIADIQRSAEAMAAEVQKEDPEYTVTMYFFYGSYNLGTAYAFGDLEQSEFRAASIWIK